MYSIVKLHEWDTPLVEDFCYKAGLAGYTNNASIEAMKFNAEYDMGQIPAFWGVVKNNELISVSGSHFWFDNLGNASMMRCLFRSATLPAYENIVPGLSKTHMNSLPFSVMLPYQIQEGIRYGVVNFYITTSNGGHDASGKMKRTHRVLQLLEKQGLVDFVSDETIYSTPQTKWELNLDTYLDALRAFHPTRVKLQLGVDRRYLNLIEYGFNSSWV